MLDMEQKAKLNKEYGMKVQKWFIDKKEKELKEKLKINYGFRKDVDGNYYDMYGEVVKETDKAINFKGYAETDSKVLYTWIPKSLTNNDDEKLAYTE